MSRLVSLAVLAVTFGGCSPQGSTTSGVEGEKSREDSQKDDPEAENKAAASVKKLGGTVVRNGKLPGNPVTRVSLAKEATDASLRELSAFRQLDVLSLNFTLVTDAGLKELATLKSLSTLSLSDTKITDAGLRELVAIKRLKVLILSYTQVTDAGLKELVAIKSLTAVYVFETHVTDAGMRELQNALPGCEVIR